MQAFREQPFGSTPFRSSPRWCVRRASRYSTNTIVSERTEGAQSRTPMASHATHHKPFVRDKRKTYESGLFLCFTAYARTSGKGRQEVSPLYKLLTVTTIPAGYTLEAADHP